MPEYDADDAISYYCYLENYDNRWSGSHTNTKEYTQLSKGVYIFHVRAYIRNSLQTYLNNDEGWEKFEENFNIVYDDFMKKLTKRYSNLKENDRKLCAYLRMGLNSKEMASLLNMSVRSIETARYRLRKKLNLESGENLTDFLQNFN